MKGFLLAVALVLFGFSCKKQKQMETICFNGVVRWAGSPAADGLGWVLYKDDSASTQLYVPQNLPDDFMVSNLKVDVCLYPTDEKLSCFCTQPLTKYHVTSIQRR